jgi:hypothetical protein
MTQEALKLALKALENGDVPTPENVGKNLGSHHRHQRSLGTARARACD